MLTAAASGASAVDTSGVPWLTILLLVPLVGAVVVAVLPRRRPQLAKQVTLGITLVELVLTIAMCVQFHQGQQGFQFGQKYSWIKAFGVSYAVGVDGAVRGIAAGVGGISGRARRLQTGFVRSYALSMLGGAVLIAGALVLTKAG